MTAVELEKWIIFYNRVGACKMDFDEASDLWEKMTGKEKTFITDQIVNYENRYKWPCYLEQT